MNDTTKWEERLFEEWNNDTFNTDKSAGFDQLKDFVYFLLSSQKQAVEQLIESKKLNEEMYWGTEKLKAVGANFVLDDILNELHKI